MTLQKPPGNSINSGKEVKKIAGNLEVHFEKKREALTGFSVDLIAIAQNEKVPFSQKLQEMVGSMKQVSEEKQTSIESFFNEIYKATLNMRNALMDPRLSKNDKVSQGNRERIVTLVDSVLKLYHERPFKVNEMRERVKELAAFDMRQLRKSSEDFESRSRPI